MSGKPASSAPVDLLKKPAKPRPWPNSWSSTVTRSIWVPWLLSRPLYQPEPVRQPGWPMALLNRAMMSSAEVPFGPGERSAPVSLLASATWYQVFWISELGKLPNTWMAPAEPSTALVAVQVSGWKDDWM